MDFIKNKGVNNINEFGILGIIETWITLDRLHGDI